VEKITEYQSKFLRSLSRWFREHPYPPTLRELSGYTGLRSTWTIRYHLKKLRDAGYLKLQKGIRRSIIMLQKTEGVPILGRVSAGKPLSVIENIEGYINFADIMRGLENKFALRVKGDSMNGAGIVEGDNVVVRKQSTAQNGDIVAAIIGDEAVVKRYFIKKGRVELHSENPKYEPITNKEIVILGIVVTVIRQYRG
jgi:repressor LexA